MRAALFVKVTRAAVRDETLLDFKPDGIGRTAVVGLLKTVGDAFARERPVVEVAGRNDRGGVRLDVGDGNGRVVERLELEAGVARGGADIEVRSLLKRHDRVLVHEAQSFNFGGGAGGRAPLALLVQAHNGVVIAVGDLARPRRIDQRHLVVVFHGVLLGLGFRHEVARPDRTVFKRDDVVVALLPELSQVVVPCRRSIFILEERVVSIQDVAGQLDVGKVEDIAVDRGRSRSLVFLFGVELRVFKHDVAGDVRILQGERDGAGVRIDAVIKVLRAGVKSDVALPGADGAGDLKTVPLLEFAVLGVVGYGLTGGAQPDGIDAL